MSTVFGFGSGSDDSSRNQSYSTTPVVNDSAIGDSRKSRGESINKQKIIEEVASTHDLSVAQSKRIVNTIFDMVRSLS